MTVSRSASDMLDQYDTQSGSNTHSFRRGKPSQSSKCLKIIFYALNSIFVLLGIGIIAGAIVALKHPIVKALAADDLVFKFVIAFGVIVLLSALIGCYGAQKESRCWLLVYVALTFVILAAFIGAGAYTVSQKNHASGWLHDAWNSSSNDSKCDVQQELKCVGWSTISDGPAQNCDGSWTKPCETVVEDNWKKVATPVAIVSLALGSLLIIGLVFSCCLMKQIRAAFAHHQMTSSDQYFDGRL